ncbi:hypothetical protein GC170_13970 [bacterium]|nr:hypothetical protein [bacterium]
MRTPNSRRGFLADVGRGTLVATLGTSLAADLEIARADQPAASDRLIFGDLEPLVALMQETPVDRLIPLAIEKMRAGTELKTLLTASALANARTFGGEDYIGFHTMMALAPAWHMSREIQGERSALPVFKVMYRNTGRINDFGGPSKEVLHPVMSSSGENFSPERLREIVRSKNMAAADSAFATIASGTGHAQDAFDAALFITGDNTEVHRTVLPYRSWDLLDVIGREWAQTLLRQSVHYCVKSERDWNHNPEMDEPRRVLPKLIDQYKLANAKFNFRPMDDAWVSALCETFFRSTPEQAAEATAAALAEGADPNAIGEAISLAANQLILRDKGRPPREVQPGKPEGSVHGDSIGVHAGDSANAWRNMARVSNARSRTACLILGAYQVAHDRTSRGGDFQNWKPRPEPAEMERITAKAQPELLAELERAIQANDQQRACAVAGRWSQLGHAPRPIFETFLKYAVSEDGALHAEKFYRTVSEDFAASRPAFQWRYLYGLARVTASEYGRKAAGYDEACERLGVTV